MKPDMFHTCYMPVTLSQTYLLTALLLWHWGGGGRHLYFFGLSSQKKRQLINVIDKLIIIVPYPVAYLSVHQHIWGFISYPVAALSIVISLCHVLRAGGCGNFFAEQLASVKNESYLSQIFFGKQLLTSAVDSSNFLPVP